MCGFCSSIPQYERLKTIFGRDRATGSLAESAADAMENINLETEVDAGTEEVTVPLPARSNTASVSSIPHEGETTSKKRKRKVGVAEDVVKMIEKGLQSVSEEMGKLVSIVGTPGLQSMPDELKAMGFDSDQCVAISMYFVDNSVQLRLWNGMNDDFKPSFVKNVLKKLGM